MSDTDSAAANGPKAETIAEHIRAAILEHRLCPAPGHAGTTELTRARPQKAAPQSQKTFPLNTLPMTPRAIGFCDEAAFRARQLRVAFRADVGVWPEQERRSG